MTERGVIMLQIEEAQAMLTEQVRKIEQTERVPLADALGRVLAEDVTAERDQPPFPRSPLDGYAVRAADVAGASKEHPAVLHVIGKICAGYVFDGVVGEGQAVRLMTGAPIPEGADAVIRQEDTLAENDALQVFVSVKPYQNYCFQGEDYKAGTVLLPEGSRLNAGKVTVLSSLGKTEAVVYRRPSVSVISTGDEVLVPGEPWHPGKIYDSNRAYICARLTEAGNPPVISMHAADEAQRVAEEIRKAAQQTDFVITTGGVSVGEKDILHDVVKLLGAKQLFWKVRIKPGSPTLAFVCDGTLVLCLSGNPFGAIANFELLARPVLAALTGQKDWELPVEDAVLQNDFRKPAGARRFLRGCLENGKVYIDGKLQSSGAIASMVECNCLVEIRPDMAGAMAGETVQVYRL